MIFAQDNPGLEKFSVAKTSMELFCPVFEKTLSNINIALKEHLCLLGELLFNTTS